jgi:lysozyme
MARKKKLAPQFLSGIDVSSFQNQVDWTKVKAAGAQFAYLKATEGVTITDTTFASNRANARAAGLVCGAYHLFRPKDTAQAQVDNFVAAVGTVEVGELPPVLDIEVPSDWANIALAARIKLVTDWLVAVEARLGVRPIVYINNPDMQALLNNDPSFSQYLLWVAYYPPAPVPIVPPPWTDWAFWQHTGLGTIGGVTGSCDLDFFQGSLADLTKLVRK